MAARASEPGGELPQRRLEHGISRPGQPLLPQLGNAVVLRRSDFTLVRQQFSGEHSEERGLSGAVGSDHSDPLSGADGEGGVPEQDLVSEPLGGVVYR